MKATSNLASSQHSATAAGAREPVRLAYVVSHPIQYQAPLLRRIAREPDIDLTVFFGSNLSMSGYKDKGFGVEVSWDVPLIEGYRSEFLPVVRDTRAITPVSPINRGILRRLRRADGSPAFDAVWLHGYASVNGLHTLLAANALGIPVLLRAESWLADRERTPWRLAAKGLFFEGLRHAVSAVLPIGTHNAAYWRHYFGDSVPQFLMPYAVDNAFFARRAAAAVPGRKELRAELHLDGERPVILFASKLQKRKHADHLVLAFRDLLAQYGREQKLGVAPYLVIVGDGEERASLETMVREATIEEHVRFAGFRNQSDLPRFFDLASVFVLPSRHEPWGLIVNEAMAAGCAVVVSSDVGSAVDLVTNGREGFVYPVGDVAALARCLESVFAAPETAQVMGENARQRMDSWSFEQDVAGLRRALAFTTGKLRA